MDVLKIAVVFAVILLVMRFKAPLWLSIGLGTVAAGLLYRLPPATFFGAAGKAAVSWGTLSLLLLVFLLTFLQKLMGRRHMLQKAETATTSLLQNRRLSAMVSPILLGLMPTPGSVLMAGEMVKTTVDGSLGDEDMAFITTFYRHIPESVLPTYYTVVLALAVAGQPAGPYMLWMLLPTLLMIVLPYFFYLRKVPKKTDTPRSRQVLKDLGRVVYYLWPVLLIIVLILAFKLETLWVAAGVTLLFVLVSRFKLSELWESLKASLELKVLAGMWMIMIFRAIFVATGAADRLPDALSVLPVPAFVIFGIIFFLGCLIGSMQAMISLVLPMAIAATGEPMAILVFLMTVGHIAAQMSPAHVCLPLCCEYFGVRFGAVVKRTLPIGVICLVAAGLYYLLMAAVL